jgi:hypothetical protein
VPRDEIATAIARCAGCFADSVATGESVDSGEGRAIHYGGNGKSSSTVEDQPRCFRRSRRWPASTLREVMKNAVLGETRVPEALRVAVVPWTSAMRALLAFIIGHDPAHNFLLKRGCCRFAQVIGIISDPKITFPYLLKICASTLGLCAAPPVPGRRRHHSLEGPIDLVARRPVRPHQRPRPDQTLVELAAP